jgi:hypothetical protein
LLRPWKFVSAISLVLTSVGSLSRLRQNMSDTAPIDIRKFVISFPELQCVLLPYDVMCLALCHTRIVRGSNTFANVDSSDLGVWRVGFLFLFSLWLLFISAPTGLSPLALNVPNISYVSHFSSYVTEFFSAMSKRLRVSAAISFCGVDLN